MAPNNVKKTLQQYRQLQEGLEGRLRELEIKRDALHSSLPPMLDETVVTEMGLEDMEEGDTQRQQQKRLLEMKKQRLRATDILIETLGLKLTFIIDIITKLDALVRDDPRQVTPMDYQVSRFYDWVDTNQQLYELNAQLYDIEKSKWNIDKPNRERPVLVIPNDPTVSMTMAGSMLQIERAMSHFEISGPSNMSLYVADRLQPRDSHMTFEATKIIEYIAECEQYQTGSLEDPPKDTQGHVRGAHPQSYHGFIEVLCNYIIERHRSSQGEDLPYATIYTAIEHSVIPRIKHYVIKYINRQEKDDILNDQCQRFAGITLSQLRVPLALRSKELVPFADAIAHMRASYFSQSPTDKMHSVVAAAKALHEQLSQLEDRGIDGDTFLDLWVYVTIKANVKDMATNVVFMSEYGNPQLSIAEAGYYLTTLYAAMHYIEKLTPEKLQQQEENNSHFVMCEREHTRLLTTQHGSCMELVNDQLELVGYKLAVIKNWVMDTSRLFSTVLVHTGDSNDIVQTVVIKLSSDISSPEHVEYFYDMFMQYQTLGITSKRIEEGFALLADPQQCDDQLILLSMTNAEHQLPLLRYAIQLIRLGSEEIEDVDEDPSFHRSLPRSVSISPYDMVPLASGRHDSTILSSVEAQLDEDKPPVLFRNRFSLPTQFNRHKKQNYITAKKESRGDSVQSDLSSPTSPPAAGIVITAEVHAPWVDSPRTMSPSTSDEECIIEKDGGKQQTLNQQDGHELSIEGKREVSGTAEDTPAPNLLSPAYIAFLEQNFTENHLYGSRTHPTKEKMIELITQCQMMLQRLNYLSSIHKLDGVFDDATMNAVQLFQIVHNQHDNFSSIRLPETGILSIATFQYLRQEQLTIFANLMRLRKDVGLELLSNFNPLSIDPDDIRHFRDAIVQFQKQLGITNCQSGVLCAKTVFHMKQFLKNRRTMSVQSNRGKTL